MPQTKSPSHPETPFLETSYSAHYPHSHSEVKRHLPSVSRGLGKPISAPTSLCRMYTRRVLSQAGRKAKVIDKRRENGVALWQFGCLGPRHVETFGSLAVAFVSELFG